MTYAEFKLRYGIILDDSQDIACQAVNGRVLLLAVPGSGKTSVTVARLGYLVHGLGFSPKSILALTYSVSGACEMQKRYRELFGSEEVEIRTINGFCAKIIRAYEKAYNKKAFSLIEGDGDTSLIIREIMKNSGQYPSDNEVKDIKSAITYCKNMMLSDDEIVDKIKLNDLNFFDVFKKYRIYKRENRLMDYDDQLSYGYTIMCRYPELVKKHVGDFRYVCVDEAQDTSKIQHMIVRKAAEAYGNLFMVGDEDQSIYGFRAAYPEGLLEFKDFYPDALICFIEKNYRSTRTIVCASNRFISQNKARHNKNMTTDNPEGEKIARTHLSDLSKLPSYIKKKAIEFLKHEGQSTAVLCRLNDSLIPIVDILSDANIPFNVRGGDGLFFTHFIVNDIKDIMSFAKNPFNSQLFGRLYYKFSAGLTKAEYEYAVAHNGGREMLSYPEYIADCPIYSEKTRKRMKRLADVLYKISNAKSCEAIKLIMSSGYGAYLSHRTNDVSKINTLLAVAERYPSKKDFFNRLEVLSGVIKEGSRQNKGIILSTIHSAKGMEFDSVILCDAKNGILPSITDPAIGNKYSREELEQLEEDRRLFYVAVTRAKKRLEFITYSSEFGEKCDGWDFVSTFINLPEDDKKTGKSANNTAIVKSNAINNYSVGDEIYHNTFGEGIVLGIRGKYAEIKFHKFSLPKRIDIIFCLENGIVKQI